MSKEQKLLSKLYECQEMMEDLLDKGKEDKHYFQDRILMIYSRCWKKTFQEALVFPNLNL